MRVLDPKPQDRCLLSRLTERLALATNTEQGDVQVNGRCKTDPLDRAEDICEACGDSFCGSCLVFPRGRKKPPVCKECALANSGLRGSGTGSTLSKREWKKRRKDLQEALEAAPPDEPAMQFFELVETTASARGAMNGAASNGAAVTNTEVSEDVATGLLGGISLATRFGAPEEFAGLEDQLADSPAGEPDSQALEQTLPDSPPTQDPAEIPAPQPAAPSIPSATARESATELLEKLKASKSEPAAEVQTQPGLEVQTQPGLDHPAFANTGPAPLANSQYPSPTAPAGSKAPGIDLEIDPFSAGEAKQTAVPSPVAPQPPPQPQPQPQPPVSQAEAVSFNRSADEEARETAAPSTHQAATNGSQPSQPTPVWTPPAPPPKGTRLNQTSSAPAPAVPVAPAAPVAAVQITPTEVAPVQVAPTEVAPVAPPPAAQPAAPTNQPSAQKADTDATGNWIPPILRGMAPQTEREATPLPKRRQE